MVRWNAWVEGKRMVRYRYSRWDGSQEKEISSHDLMDQLTDSILEGNDLRRAMRQMLEHGAELPNGKRMEGMRNLMDRLRQAREQALDKYDLSSMMANIQDRLDDVVDTERAGIKSRLGELDPADGDGQPGEGQPGEGQPGGPNDGAPTQEMRDLLKGMADKHLEQLAGLPPQVGGRITELRQYDFMDPEARKKFDELLEELQKQVMENYFKGMQESIQTMSPGDLQQAQEMIKDLNELTRRKLNGEAPDITEFMQKWGQYFPPGIETFDQLADHLRQQMAQMQSLLNSMSPEQRSELQSMMEALLQDNRLQWDMFELSYNLDRLDPDAASDNRFSLTGDEPLTLQEALRLMGDLNSMEDMEGDLYDALRHNDPSRLDADEMGRLLGDEARQYAKDLQRMMKELEEAGFLKKGDRGYELTPKAIRKIGERALQDIFRKMRGGQMGDHDHEKSGIGVELLDETKQWQFGDPFHLNTLKTVSNAVIRQGPGTPVRIKPEDFEINHTETMNQASTVIALDMSASMMWSGYFQAGQRVGLALDTLIKTKYPKDNVTVVAFSYFVLPVDAKMLLDSYWVEYGGGTNFQEVLRYSRELLRRQSGTTKQIILITDGEPTTYNWVEDRETLEWEGEDPDDPMTYYRRRRRSGVVEETLREVQKCTRDNITINTFMLDRSPALLEFVRMMAKKNKGRAFIADPEQLGTYVVADYFSMRNRVIH